MQTKHWIMSIVAGIIALFGGAKMIGVTTVQQISSNGTATALTSVVTSTLTAAQVCNSSFLSITPVTGTPTITLPATTTLFANCIGSVGQYWDVNYQSLTTSTVLAAGAGGTIINSSASTVAANKGAILRFIHNTSNTYLLYIVNVVN